jgi:hypothetical protein
MRALKDNPNIDNSDLANYPDGRVKDNTGSGNGTAVNERTKGDWHQAIAKLMRDYDILPNGLPDNVTNGYQIVDALWALASKNDYIYPLNTNGTDTLSIDIKLSLMKDGEFLTCLASADKTTETLIKGTGPASMAVTYSGNFKANEYVRVIKTAVGVSIIRVADWNSLNAMCTELLFLKKASQLEEDAGSIDTVATTPKVNKVTFAKRVIGADSENYLAKPTGDPDERNGLMSKADKAIIDGIGANPVKNIGWFGGLDPGGTSGSIPVGGDVVGAGVTNISSGSVINVQIANPMDSTDYFVRMHVRSESSSGIENSNISCPVFKIIDTSHFHVRIADLTGGAQNLKVHLEVYQL